MVSMAAGVVLYNPEEEDIENILKFANIYDFVFLYKNSELSDCDIIRLSQSNKIVFLGSGNNDGLSIACSSICNTAKDLGLDYVSIYDQDSRISAKSIKILSEYVKNKINKENVAIICPRIIVGNNVIKNKTGCKVVDWCITSGSIINLNIFSNEIEFDNNYFIDRVDSDFCMNIRNLGFSIVLVNDAVLVQKLGLEKKVMGRKYSSHSALRHYYISRNRLYYNKKYSISRWISFLQMIKHLLEIIIFENDKRNKLRMFKEGLSDYKKNNMGKKKDDIVC
ncbi:MAG: hypothetical protein ACPKNR_04040 [Pleomorphochaeta sp.]